MAKAKVSNDPYYNASGRGLSMHIDCILEPTPLTTGNTEYYFNRFTDFMERHPDCNHTPPDYYYGVLVDNDTPIEDKILKVLTQGQQLPTYPREEGEMKPDPTKSYGHKYCVLFTNLRPELSTGGIKWLDLTLINLQNFLEKGVIDKSYISKYNERFNNEHGLDVDDLVGVRNFYTNIELKNDVFRDFAFATHPDAYNPEIMAFLPLHDLLLIMLTPQKSEWGDLATWEQAFIVAKELLPMELTYYGIRIFTIVEHLKKIADSGDKGYSQWLHAMVNQIEQGEWF